MRERYTAVIRQGGPWWIGWIEEVPGVDGQEATREERLASRREPLEMNRQRGGPRCT